MAKKLKGKEWYTLIAPRMFDGKNLGETPVGDPATLIGRKVEVPLINLINDPRKYYMKFQFRIKELDGKIARTEFAGLECLRDYISRMVRHGVTRIDMIQDLTTKDGVKLRVKTITLTNRRVKKSIESGIRRFVEEMVKKEVESSGLDGFLEKIINDTIKNQILDEGSRIYPLRVFEFRKVERVYS